MKRQQPAWRWKILATLVGGMGLLLLGRQAVWAGPVSSGGIGTTVYQGLMVVSSDTSQGLLELGNNGTDIATNGTLYLRPNAVDEAHAALLTKSASTGFTDLHLTGGVCFGSLPCVDTWPSGSGSSVWQVVGTNLQPITSGGHITFTKTGIDAQPSVSVVGNNPTGEVVAVSNSGGSAAQFEAASIIVGNISLPARAAGDEIQITAPCQTGPGNCLYKVWHAGNDGHTTNGTGPDASMLDGVQLYFKRDTTCGNSFTASAHNCFCADDADYNVRCIALQ